MLDAFRSAAGKLPNSATDAKRPEDWFIVTCGDSGVITNLDPSVGIVKVQFPSGHAVSSGWYPAEIVEIIAELTPEEKAANEQIKAQAAAVQRQKAEAQLAARRHAVLEEARQAERMKQEKMRRAQELQAQAQALAARRARAALNIQRHGRGYLSRRQHTPRLQAIRGWSSAQTGSDHLEFVSLIAGLETGLAQDFTQQVGSLEEQQAAGVLSRWAPDRMVAHVASELKQSEGTSVIIGPAQVAALSQPDIEDVLQCTAAQLHELPPKPSNLPEHLQAALLAADPVAASSAMHAASKAASDQLAAAESAAAQAAADESAVRRALDALLDDVVNSSAAAASAATEAAILAAGDAAIEKALAVAEQRRAAEIKADTQRRIKAVVGALGNLCVVHSDETIVSEGLRKLLEVSNQTVSDRQSSSTSNQTDTDRAVSDTAGQTGSDDCHLGDTSQSMNDDMVGTQYAGQTGIVAAIDTDCPIMRVQLLFAAVETNLTAQKAAGTQESSLRIWFPYTVSLHPLSRRECMTLNVAFNSVSGS
eukprot:SAG31_NODE_236_length_19594_cov_7.018620_3_plen_535_part_00